MTSYVQTVRRGLTTFLVFLSVAVAQSQTADATPPANETIQLDPFTVTSSEGKGYLHTTSTVATRTNRATLEVPQSLSVVTDDFLIDTSAFTQEDAATYVSNVFTRDRFAATLGGFIIRGFEGEDSAYVDGFRSSNYRRDTAGYERMEIVKGPPSAVQGRSGASGLVNWVTKKPFHDNDFLRSSVVLGYGANEDRMFRLTADANRTLTAAQSANSLSVRGVAVYQRGDAWIDFLPDNVYAFYPSLRWKLGNRTELTVFGELLQAESPSRDIGAGPNFYSKKYRDKFSSPVLGGNPNDPISALNIPYGANPVGPGSVRNTHVKSGMLALTHKFNEHFDYRQGYQFLKTDADDIWFIATARTDQIFASHLGVPGVWMNVNRGGGVIGEIRHTVQGDLLAQFDLGRHVRSVSMLGYEWWQSESADDAFNLTLAPQFTRTNFADIPSDPNYYRDRITGTVLARSNRLEIDNFSYFIQQEFELFNRLMLQGAWRRDERETSNRNRLTNVFTDTDDSTDSTRVGATFFLNRARSLAFYTVLSDQENPSENQAEWLNLNAGDPRLNNRLIWSPTMKLFEVGFKAELLDHRLSFSVARFDMTKDGFLNTVQTPTISQGEQLFSSTQRSLSDATSKGWEIELVGNVTRQLSFISNLTFNDAKENRVVSNVLVTQRMHRVPKWNYNLFAKYDFGAGTKLKGLSVRGGVHAYADFEGTFNGIRTALTDTFRQFDAGISYRWKNYTADLFVRNLDDAPLILFLGAPPRQVRFTFSGRW